MKEAHSIKSILQKVISNLATNCKAGDWLKTKMNIDNFNQYIKFHQNPENSRRIKELDNKFLERKTIKSPLLNNKTAELDCVFIKPQNNKNNSNYNNKYVVYFGGRSESWEAKTIKEAAVESDKLGINTVVFNYPGMHKSKGQITHFDDLVNSGISIVKDLVENHNVNPQDIILKGNCLGSSVASGVQEELFKQNVGVRTVLGNTFSKLPDVIFNFLPKVLQTNTIKKCLDQLLGVAGWNYDIENKNLVQTPYTWIINRNGDKTIKTKAQLHNTMKKNKKSLIDDNLSLQNDLKIPDYPQNFFEQVELYSNKPGDPHIKRFNEMKWKDKNGKEQSSDVLFNEYIKESDKFFATKENNKMYKSPSIQHKNISSPQKDLSLSQKIISQKLFNELSKKLDNNKSKNPDINDKLLTSRKIGPSRF